MHDLFSDFQFEISYPQLSIVILNVLPSDNRRSPGQSAAERLEGDEFSSDRRCSRTASSRAMGMDALDVLPYRLKMKRAIWGG